MSVYSLAPISSKRSRTSSKASTTQSHLTFGVSSWVVSTQEPETNKRCPIDVRVVGHRDGRSAVTPFPSTAASPNSTLTPIIVILQ